MFCKSIVMKILCFTLVYDLKVVWSKNITPSFLVSFIKNVKGKVFTNILIMFLFSFFLTFFFCLKLANYLICKTKPLYVKNKQSYF